MRSLGFTTATVKAKKMSCDGAKQLFARWEKKVDSRDRAIKARWGRLGLAAAGARGDVDAKLLTSVVDEGGNPASVSSRVELGG